MPKAIDENRVFEVTATLFVRHGYAGTKTKEIAEAAGVNEATLFRRYGSKAMLIGAAIDHQWREVPLAGLEPSDDVEADLVTIVEAYLETNRLLGAIVPALLVELARSADLRDAFGAALENVRGLAADPPTPPGSGSSTGRGAHDGVGRAHRAAHGSRDVAARRPWPTVACHRHTVVCSKLPGRSPRERTDIEDRHRACMTRESLCRDRLRT